MDTTTNGTKHIEREYIDNDGKRTRECDCAEHGKEGDTCPTRQRREWAEDTVSIWGGVLVRAVVARRDGGTVIAAYVHGHSGSASEIAARRIAARVEAEIEQRPALARQVSCVQVDRGETSAWVDGVTDANAAAVREIFDAATLAVCS